MRIGGVCSLAAIAAAWPFRRVLFDPTFGRIELRGLRQSRTWPVRGSTERVRRAGVALSPDPTRYCRRSRPMR